METSLPKHLGCAKIIICWYKIHTKPPFPRGEEPFALPPKRYEQAIARKRLRTTDTNVPETSFLHRFSVEVVATINHNCVGHQGSHFGKI